MKRILALLIVVFASNMVFAQQPDFPKSVRDAYAAKYAAPATFSKKGELYAAEFTDKNTNYAAYFAEDGTWAKTEKTITFETLKEAVRSEIQNRFLGEGSRYSLDKALVIETPTGTYDAVRLFMTDGGTLTLYFNADGTMTKREVVR